MRSAALAQTFRESPRAAERTCRLLGSSRLLGDALRRQPDFVEALGDDDTLSRVKSRDELVEEAYRFCARARNAQYLLTGRPGGALPTDGREATRLGRLLGYGPQPQARLRDDYRRVTRRARKVVERVFYGQS